MENIEVFKEFRYPYTAVLSKKYDKSNENLQLENLEDLIYETKDTFIKNTQQKTSKVFSNLELAEVNKIV